MLARCDAAEHTGFVFELVVEAGGLSTDDSPLR
jgi:hypothetical protein